MKGGHGMSKTKRLMLLLSVVLEVVSIIFSIDSIRENINALKDKNY